MTKKKIGAREKKNRKLKSVHINQYIYKKSGAEIYFFCTGSNESDLT